MTEPAVRAARGAEALDMCEPTWADQGRIDLRKLDVDDGRNCPLGQLKSNFTRGANILFPGLSRTVMYGLGFLSFTGDIDALNKAWKDEIKKRRAR